MSIMPCPICQTEYDVLLTHCAKCGPIPHRETGMAPPFRYAPDYDKPGVVERVAAEVNWLHHIQDPHGRRKG